MSQALVSIGTSGFSYDHWGKGVFYPSRLPRNQWLEYYAGHFKTVELNVSFYRLPTARAFQSWYKRTPGDFTFAVKGSRFITHIKRLGDCEEPLELLMGRAGVLKEKLGLFLWQFPAQFSQDEKRLENFGKLLKRYGDFRHAFEFRNGSWFTGKIFRILESHKFSLVLADWPQLAVKKPLTGDFVYIRRHGAGEDLYGGRYSDEQLKADARAIRRWLREGKDVFIYFNNDAHGWAVKNALTLRGLLERE